MQAPKSLRRPENWQDFESLSKKLWGEIWNCPEIKKNGRNGQQQHGVDIYGIPSGETSYYGIQCKGKGTYTNQQFSETEITEEIAKAKNFQPPLKKLYFATTAVKDVSIEAFVRLKNIENITDGIFEVHLFSWEDIVDLIDENKQTHDWYISNQKFKTEKDAILTFEGGSTEITCCPKFKQITSCYTLEHNESVPAIWLKNNKSLLTLISSPPFKASELNLSFFKTSFVLTNSGTTAIEEYKVILKFEGDIVDLKDSNESGGFPFVNIHYVPTISLNSIDKTAKLIPRNKILVGSDTFFPEDIFIKAKPVDSKLIVQWNLISKDFRKEGELIINVRPEIEKKRSYIQVNHQLDVRREVGEIEDYIIPKD